MLYLFHSLVNAKVPNFPLFLANKNNKIHIMNLLLTFREMVRYIDLQCSQKRLETTPNCKITKIGTPYPTHLNFKDNGLDMVL